MGIWDSLIIKRLTEADDIEPLSRDMSNEEIFSYLSEEIFEQKDPLIKDFLIKTSLCPEITVELANELTGGTSAKRILQYLTNHPFFTEVRKVGGRSYKYHDLFSEFLKVHARETLGEKYAELQFKTAQALEKHGFFYEAAKLYSAVKAWDRLINIIYLNVKTLLDQGRTKLVIECIEGVPESVINANPWVIYWKGTCLLSENPLEARLYFETSYKKFKELNYYCGIFLSWSNIVNTYTYELRNFAPLDYWIEEFENIYDMEAQFPSKDVEERVIASVFSALLFRDPGHYMMTRFESHALKIINNDSSSTNKLFLGSNLIFYYIWNGRANAAKGVLDTLYPEYKKYSDLQKLMYLRTKALYYLIACQPDEMIKAVEEGLTISSDTGIEFLELALYGQMIHALLQKDDVNKAQEYLNRMLESRKTFQSFELIYYNHQSSLIAARCGKFSEAIYYAENSLKAAVESGSPFLAMIHTYALVNVLIEAGQYEKTDRYFLKIMEIGKRTKSPFAEYLCLIMKSLISAHTGDDTSFSDYFKEAIEFSKQNGAFIFSYFYPANFLIYKKALALGIEVDYVKSVIKSIGMTADDSCMEIKDWPWQVKIYALGRFQIQVDGRPVSLSGKVQKMPFSLLKALTSFGSMEQPGQCIADTLWPDSDGDLAQISFNTTLHRLRSFFQNKDVINYSNGYIKLNRKVVWSDVFALEHLLKKSEQLLKNDTKENNCDTVFALFEQALDLYRGDFLPADEDKPWALANREKIKQKFINYCKTSGQFFIKHKKWEAALMCYRKLIETDTDNGETYKVKIAFLEEKSDGF
ncbi:MAG: hypothetical protein HQK94_04135 [Nitrospirae bacterium]|nr:hypothetical protein [Nitrospirota bacterium]